MASVSPALRIHAAPPTTAAAAAHRRSTTGRRDDEAIATTSRSWHALQHPGLFVLGRRRPPHHDHLTSRRARPSTARPFTTAHARPPATGLRRARDPPHKPGGSARTAAHGRAPQPCRSMPGNPALLPGGWDAQALADATARAPAGEAQPHAPYRADPYAPSARSLASIPRRRRELVSAAVLSAARRLRPPGSRCRRSRCSRGAPGRPGPAAPLPERREQRPTRRATRRACHWRSFARQSRNRRDGARKMWAARGVASAARPIRTSGRRRPVPARPIAYPSSCQYARKGTKAVAVAVTATWRRRAGRDHDGLLQARPVATSSPSVRTAEITASACSAAQLLKLGLPEAN